MRDFGVAPKLLLEVTPTFSNHLQSEERGISGVSQSGRSRSISQRVGSETVGSGGASRRDEADPGSSDRICLEPDLRTPLTER